MKRPPLAGLAMAGLLVLAGALRLWHLWDIPSPTDELLGVGRGLSIAWGEIYPLTDFEPYIGSLWNYLLAAPFKLFGPSQYVGRAVPWLVGVLTVPAAYLLAREVAGRTAGWVAALLMATSSAHVLATSHPGWSHCLIPLFLSLGLWQLHRALRLRQRSSMLAAGGWLGLSLQAHLTSLAFLPGVAALFLLRGRDWLRTRWPYLAALISIALIANILVFNAQTGLGSVRRASAVSEAYARPKAVNDTPYVGNAQRMAVGLLRTVSGAIDVRDHPEDFLRDPLVIGPAAVSAIGLALLATRGELLPLLVMASYLGLLVIFNAKYEAIPNARFLTPMLPLAFAGTGALIARLWKPPATRPAVALLVFVLAASSALGLGRRLDQMADSAQTTAMVFRTADAVEAARRPSETVLLDRNLDRLWLDGGGDLYMALRFELTRRRVPVADLPRRLTPPSGETNPCRRYRVTLVRVDVAQGVPDWLAPGLGPDPSQLPRVFWTFRPVPREPRQVALGQNEQVVMEYLPPINGSSRTVDRCTPGRQI